MTTAKASEPIEGRAPPSYPEQAAREAARLDALSITDAPPTPKMAPGSERDLAARAATLDAGRCIARHLAEHGVTRRCETWRVWAAVLGLDDPERDFRNVRRATLRRLDALARWNILTWNEHRRDPRRGPRIRRRPDGSFVTVGGGTVHVWLVGIPAQNTGTSEARTPAQNTGTEHRHTSNMREMRREPLDGFEGRGRVEGGEPHSSPAQPRPRMTREQVAEMYREMNEAERARGLKRSEAGREHLDRVLSAANTLRPTSDNERR